MPARSGMPRKMHKRNLGGKVQSILSKVIFELKGIKSRTNFADSDNYIRFY